MAMSRVLNEKKNFQKDAHHSADRQSVNINPHENGIFCNICSAV